MDRFPMVITVGGMLLGWIAGTMAVTDPAVIGYMPLEADSAKDARPEVLSAVRYAAGIAGALLVLAIGKVLAGRRPAEPGAAG
jgi:predicted tellurium resistance membrane protein TerC